MVKRQIFHFSSQALMLDWRRIANKTGVSRSMAHSNRLADIFNRAKGKLLEVCRPVGMLKEVAIGEFCEIYSGKGENEHPAPLASIYPKADHLAIYVVTIGNAVGSAMAELTHAGELTAAYMFDLIASEVTEAAADALQTSFEDQLKSKRAYNFETKLLRYSPGYCGWHISGQANIFKFLKPEEIGVRLGNGFIMRPLKSNSGVMVSGLEEIHRFQNNYSFCMVCKSHNCRERINRGAKAHV